MHILPVDNEHIDHLDFIMENTTLFWDSWIVEAFKYSNKISFRKGDHFDRIFYGRNIARGKLE